MHENSILCLVFCGSILDKYISFIPPKWPECKCLGCTVKKNVTSSPTGFPPINNIRYHSSLWNVSVQKRLFMYLQTPGDSAPRWVGGYQQWLKPEGYVLRERNSITGKRPVIETIPGIPKPTLHHCCSWHRPAFHYYCLLLRMLMSKHSTWQRGEECVPTHRGGTFISLTVHGAELHSEFQRPSEIGGSGCY